MTMKVAVKQFLREKGNMKNKIYLLNNLLQIPKYITVKDTFHKTQE